VGEGQQHERCNAAVHAWLVVAAWGRANNMSAATDAVVRAWLVVAAWIGLGRARLARLARIRHPRPFVRAAILPAGRLVALAIAFLPRKRRGEARIAFLSCRALAGFDDPDVAVASERITAAVAYLTGEAHSAPRSAVARSMRASHRFDALLAARLPTLRAAIKALPGDALRRCCAVIERIGDGMIHARVDRRSRIAGGGVDHVFGEAVFAAARFAVPAVRAPVFACNAAGRAIQLASALRDAETDATRDMLLYQALQELPTVPRLLRWLPDTACAGTRAAAALLAVSTYRFYLQHITAEVPRRLRHPLRAALAAASSRRAYLGVVTAIEDGFHDALDALAVRLDGPAPAMPALLPALPPHAIASSGASAEPYRITPMQQPLEQ
jgi:hypothetical protein